MEARPEFEPRILLEGFPSEELEIAGQTQRTGSQNELPSPAPAVGDGLLSQKDQQSNRHHPPGEQAGDEPLQEGQPLRCISQQLEVEPNQTVEQPRINLLVGGPSVGKNGRQVGQRFPQVLEVEVEVNKHAEKHNGSYPLEPDRGHRGLKNGESDGAVAASTLAAGRSEGEHGVGAAHQHRDEYLAGVS